MRLASFTIFRPKSRQHDVALERTNSTLHGSNFSIICQRQAPCLHHPLSCLVDRSHRGLQLPPHTNVTGRSVPSTLTLTDINVTTLVHVLPRAELKYVDATVASLHLSSDRFSQSLNELTQPQQLQPPPPRSMRRRLREATLVITSTTNKHGNLNQAIQKKSPHKNSS